MKIKQILIAILVLMIVAGVAIFIFMRPLSLTMEEIFPSDVLMYARLSHVENDVEHLIQGDVWKNLSTIDLPKVLEHNNFSKQEVNQLRSIQSEMGLFLSSPWTKRLFGKEIAVGFYNNKDSHSKALLNSYGVLFATRLPLSFQMAELFASMAHQWSDDVTTQNEKYSNFNLVHVHFKKRKLDIQYVRIHDILLVSLYPSDLLYQAIDVLSKKRHSLHVDENFSQTFNHAYPNGHGIFYVNVHKTYDIFKKFIPKDQGQEFNDMSEGFTGFNSYAVSFLPGEIMRLKMMIGFESSHLGEYWQSFFACKGPVNDSLKFIPHNVMIYHWGGCYDFQDTWMRLRGSLDSTGNINDNVHAWKKRIEKRLKLDVYDDILPILGSQVGIYLNDIDTQGLFAYPRAVFFVKTNNHTAAEKIMERVAQNPLTFMQKEEYQKSSIQYMTLPLGANMDPGYTFLGDYLLIGSSRQLLKASIDAFSNPNQSFESNAISKQFSLKSNQGIAYIKIDEVSKRLQQLLDYYNKIVSSQITTALSYEKEVIQRRKELEQTFISNKKDLVLAKDKLKELVVQEGLPNLTEDEKIEIQSRIEHLKPEIKMSQEDVDAYQAQKSEIIRVSQKYQKQSDDAKGWLFNSDEVFMPVLKSLENLHEIGIRMYLNGQISEIEIFIQ